VTWDDDGLFSQGITAIQAWLRIGVPKNKDRFALIAWDFAVFQFRKCQTGHSLHKDPATIRESTSPLSSSPKP
jgi:hypothetical protein